MLFTADDFDGFDKQTNREHYAELWNNPEIVKVLIEPFGDINSAMVALAERYGDNARFVIGVVTSTEEKVRDIKEHNRFRSKTGLEWDQMRREEEGPRRFYISAHKALHEKWRQAADMIWVNYKMEHFVSSCSVRWIESLNPSKPPIIVTMIKSFSPEGCSAIEHLRQCINASFHSPEYKKQLEEKLCNITGYTSAPLIVEKEEIKEINIISVNPDIAHEVKCFLIGDRESTQTKETHVSVKSTASCAEFSELREEFYYDKLRVAITGTSLTRLEGSSMAGALKNIIVHNMACLLVYFSLSECEKNKDLSEKDFAERVSDWQSSLITDACERGAAFVRQIYSDYGSFSKEIITDIKRCAGVQYPVLYALIRELLRIRDDKQLEKHKKIQAVVDEIAKIEKNNKQPLGSRNAQLGFFLTVALYCQKWGLCGVRERDYRLIYHDEKKKQEVVTALESLYRRFPEPEPVVESPKDIFEEGLYFDVLTGEMPVTTLLSREQMREMIVSVKAPYDKIFGLTPAVFLPQFGSKHKPTLQRSYSSTAPEQPEKPDLLRTQSTQNLSGMRLGFNGGS